MESQQSKTDCHDEERIRQESILAAFSDEVEKMQQRCGTARLPDFFDVNSEGHALLQKYFVRSDDKRPNGHDSSSVIPVLDATSNEALDAELSQTATTTRHPEMDCSSSRLTGDYDKDKTEQITSSEYAVQKNLVRPSEEMRPSTNHDQQFHQMILVIQKQLDILIVIQQQKLLRDEVKLQKQAQVSSDFYTLLPLPSSLFCLDYSVGCARTNY